MTTLTPTNLRKDLFKVLENTVKFNERVNIVTKDGNAILISEEEWNGLIATLEIYSNPKLKEKIIEGMNTPLSETISEEDIEW